MGPGTYTEHTLGPKYISHLDPWGTCMRTTRLKPEAAQASKGVRMHPGARFRVYGLGF